jgi:fumarylacetoacetase
MEKVCFPIPDLCLANHMTNTGFGTSISPWIVTLEALRPFRCAPKTKQNPAPFPHLTWCRAEDATINVKLKISLIRRSSKQHVVVSSNVMMTGKGKHMDVATSNLRYLYWTPFQQLAHHASAMCGMETGDLIGTGTISGDV